MEKYNDAPTTINPLAHFAFTPTRDERGEIQATAKFGGTPRQVKIQLRQAYAMLCRAYPEEGDLDE